MRELFTVYHRAVSLQRIDRRSRLRVKRRPPGSQIVRIWVGANFIVRICISAIARFSNRSHWLDEAEELITPTSELLQCVRHILSPCARRKPIRH